MTSLKSSMEIFHTFSRRKRDEIGPAFGGLQTKNPRLSGVFSVLGGKLPSIVAYDILR